MNQRDAAPRGIAPPAPPAGLRARALARARQTAPAPRRRVRAIDVVLMLTLTLLALLHLALPPRGFPRTPWPAELRAEVGEPVAAAVPSRLPDPEDQP